MFHEAFEKLKPAQTQEILANITPLFKGAEFSPHETTIMALDVPFYKGFKILDIADYTVMPANKRFVLYSPRKSAVLNFTNEAIYALNKEVPITLCEETVEDYIRFFFTYVHGKHGRFMIIENIDDMNWKEDPPPVARKAISHVVMPVTLLDLYEDGGYHLECTMIFKDSLFKANIDVTADGSVNLTNEELLIEEMPVLDDRFGQ